ncbi:MAG: hydantoinase/oxoprolinase family protein, partial [Betaproteobacteria bacterium]
YTLLDAELDTHALDAMRTEMRGETAAFIRKGSQHGELSEAWTADMRYRGQGHDLTVPIPAQNFSGTGAGAAVAQLTALFEREYERVFGITIPGMQVEVMSWALRMAAPKPPLPACPPTPAAPQADPRGERPIFDARTGERRAVPLYWRFDLLPGANVPGPAVIAEEETSTVVTEGFNAQINALGHIVMHRKRS